MIQNHESHIASEKEKECAWIEKAPIRLAGVRLR